MDIVGLVILGALGSVLIILVTDLAAELLASAGDVVRAIMIFPVIFSESPQEALWRKNQA
jgi:hypothetical protein